MCYVCMFNYCSVICHGVLSGSCFPSLWQKCIDILTCDVRMFNYRSVICHGVLSGSCFPSLWQKCIDILTCEGLPPAPNISSKWIQR